MEIEEKAKVSKDMLLKRLKRVEGQIRGIQKMIDEDRDCVSIVMQLAAVRSSIGGIGALVLNNCMKLCFRGETATECVDVESLARAISIWVGVHVGK